MDSQPREYPTAMSEDEGVATTELDGPSQPEVYPVEERYTWGYDGERYWIGCPPGLPKEKIIEEMAHTHMALKHLESMDYPDLREPRENIENDEGNEKNKENMEKDENMEGGENKENKENKDEAAEITKPGDQEKAENVEPEVTPDKADAQPKTKPKQAVMGEISWQPLSKTGFNDFLDTCSGCRPAPHDTPAQLHPKVSVKPQEFQLTWAPCTKKGVAAFTQIFSQAKVNFATMTLPKLIDLTKGFLDAATGQGGHFMPDDVPSYAHDAINYMVMLRRDWNVVEPDEVDYWMKNRLGLDIR